MKRQDTYLYKYSMTSIMKKIVFKNKWKKKNQPNKKTNGRKSTKTVNLLFFGGGNTGDFKLIFICFSA